MCFKKKVVESGFVEDRELLLLCAQDMDVIIMMAKDKQSPIIDELLEIKDMIRYLSPSSNAVMYDLDLKIKSKVQDLKIHLIKEQIKDYSVIFRCIKDVKIMIKDRDVRELK